jgi:hypothetical protein
MLIQSQHNEDYLTFNDEEHTYTLNGKLVPGVTTINKKGYPVSPHLITWLSKQAAWYIIETLKQFPEQVNRLPNYLLDEIAKKSTQAGKKIAKEAADIGSLVHSWAELDGLKDVKGIQALLQTINTHIDCKKILNCVDEYMKWSKESKYETVDAEQTIASVQYQYAGKYDRLVKSGSKIILIDFKTSSGLFAEHWQQVSGAYRLGLREWRDIEIDGVDLVRFGKDGSFEHKLLTKKSEMEDHTEQFLRNLKTAKYRENYEPARYKPKSKTLS